LVTACKVSYVLVATLAKVQEPELCRKVQPGTPKVQTLWRSLLGVNLSGKRTEQPGTSGELQLICIRLGTEGASRKAGETLRSVTGDDNVTDAYRVRMLDVLFLCRNMFAATNFSSPNVLFGTARERS
jgi:hypothetical protein